MGKITRRYLAGPDDPIYKTGVRFSPVRDGPLPTNHTKPDAEKPSGAKSPNDILKSEERDQTFGCEFCWPADTDAACEARGKLPRQAELIDESHFHVMLLACPKCEQRFVSVFSEIIDWSDGEAPQYWILLPITETEAEMLIRKGDSLKEKELEALGPNRRCLRRDYPKGGAPETYWGTGMWVGMHD